ncbi:hypothetical protein ABT278_29460 [Streptomyces sp. NPDC001228]|uniref:hypothetical protein n=1 Tax=Streptomyces sp. NPDC001228 TaxID=3154381 RepID=UPI003328A2F5
MFTDGVADLCDAVRDLHTATERDFADYDARPRIEPAVDYPYMVQVLHTRHEELQRLWTRFGEVLTRAQTAGDEEALRILEGVKESIGHCADNIQDYEQFIPIPQP